MHAVEARFPMRSGRKLMNAKVLVTAIGALAMVGCTPDWAKNGDAPVVLLMTGINDGAPLTSDVRISTGAVCPDSVPLRLENHFKNPRVTATGFKNTGGAPGISAASAPITAGKGWYSMSISSAASFAWFSVSATMNATGSPA